jgi:hypothetical protein
MKLDPRYIYCFLVVLMFSGCQQVNENWKEESHNPEFLHRSLKQLTDVIVWDIFSPPQAARNYAYASIAAYEVIQQEDTDFESLAGQLKDLKEVPAPPNNQEINFPLAAVQAFINIGTELIFSEDKMRAFQQEIHQEFKAINMPKDVYTASIDYGNQVAVHIKGWIKTDKYAQTRSFPKFSVTNEVGRWRPTPPGYMDGIEPAWKEIRPFVIESAAQFQPPFPTNYDMTPGSLFYKEVQEVYNAVVESGEEEKEIASFWDCNPYVLNVTGHVMHATKKITPGGHWMGIVSIACRKEGANFIRSAQAYTLTAIALHDGFISCWDEKYRSNLVRPETVINEYIDEDWVPLLQTPPFPEYTSGHSVISGAAAITLTHLFGDNFSFEDDTEVEYGLPVRNYRSFLHASDEAAISRLYGGIHYRPAIDNGVSQGRELGRYIIKQLNLTNS